MGDYKIRLDVRGVELEFGTATLRDTDYAKIVKFLKNRGVTTANASVMKLNAIELYDANNVKIKKDDVIILVPEDNALPQPVTEEVI